MSSVPVYEDLAEALATAQAWVGFVFDLDSWWRYSHQGAVEKFLARPDALAFVRNEPSAPSVFAELLAPDGKARVELGVFRGETHHHLALNCFSSVRGMLLCICGRKRGDAPDWQPSELTPERFERLVRYLDDHIPRMPDFGGADHPFFTTLDEGLLRETKDTAARRAMLPAAPVSNGSYYVKELADKHNVDAETLRKRLETWRKGKDCGWEEVTSPKRGQPRYKYIESAVIEVIKSLTLKSR